MLGHISAGRADSGVDLAGCVSVAGLFPSASGGLPPRILPPFEGVWVDRPAPEGNADGTVGIFEKCRERVGNGPAPRPTKKKGLVPHFHVRWGVELLPLHKNYEERWIWHKHFFVYFKLRSLNGQFIIKMYTDFPRKFYWNPILYQYIDVSSNQLIEIFHHWINAFNGKLYMNFARMINAGLNESWKLYHTKQLL